MLVRRVRAHGSFPKIPTTVSPNAEGRLTLWSAGNTYTWGCVNRGGVLHLIYTESPTSEHAAGTTAKYKTSSDLGYTWSAATTLYSGSGAGFHGEAQGITLSPTGRLIASVIDAPDGGGSANVTGYVRYSDNGGSTWSSPYGMPITASGTEKYALGPAIVMPDNSLIMPCTRTQPTVLDTISLTSTDDGATWGSQITVASNVGVREYTEPSGGRLPDGTLVMLMRSDTNQHMWRVTSGSSGVTWGTPADVLAAGGPPQFVQWYPGHGSMFLVLRVSNTNFAARWSTTLDGGATWASLQEVDSGETRELDSCALVMLDTTTILAIYALANSSTSSTVYRRKFDIT